MAGTWKRQHTHTHTQTRGSSPAHRGSRTGRWCRTVPVLRYPWGGGAHTTMTPISTILLTQTLPPLFTRRLNHPQPVSTSTTLLPRQHKNTKSRPKGSVHNVSASTREDRLGDFISICPQEGSTPVQDSHLPYPCGPAAYMDIINSLCLPRTKQPFGVREGAAIYT